MSGREGRVILPHQGMRVSDGHMLAFPCHSAMAILLKICLVVLVPVQALMALPMAEMVVMVSPRVSATRRKKSIPIEWQTERLEDSLWNSSLHSGNIAWLDFDVALAVEECMSMLQVPVDYRKNKAIGQNYAYYTVEPSNKGTHALCLLFGAQKHINAMVKGPGGVSFVERSSLSRRVLYQRFHCMHAADPLYRALLMHPITSHALFHYCSS